MTKEEAKQWVTDEVSDYQSKTGHKAFLSKTDFYYFTGALVYSSEYQHMDILKDIQDTLSRVPMNR